MQRSSPNPANGVPLNGRRLSLLGHVGRVVRKYFGSAAVPHVGQASNGEGVGGVTAAAAQAREQPRVEVRAYDVEAVTDDYRRLYFPDDVPNLEPIAGLVRANAESHPTNIGADERFCVELLRFANSSMSLGEHATYEPASVILANGISSCGGYSLVMCEIARVSGLPARYLGIFGIPSAGSHALVEVYFDGRWHLFDPTFGVFFYSAARWDGTGHVLSAAEIVASRERPTLIQAVEKPWGRDYREQRRFSVQPLLDPPTSHVLSYWSEEGRRSVFPVAFGNDAVMSVPVDIDLRSQRSFDLGECTGKWQDTWWKCIADRRNGYFQIGGLCPTIVHCVRIKAEVPARLTVRYVAAGGSAGSLGAFPLAGCFLLATETDGTATTFSFFINSVDPSFLLIAEKYYFIDMARYVLDVEGHSQTAHRPSRALDHAASNAPAE